MSTSTYQIGLKSLIALAREGDSIAWYKAKLEKSLFKGTEISLYDAFVKHLEKHKKLPNLTTMLEKYPDLSNVLADEPSRYYLDLLDERYAYDLINATNVETQKMLAEDKTATDKAIAMMADTVSKARMRSINVRLVNFRTDAPALVLNEYHKTSQDQQVSNFFWPYMDNMSGGAMAGDVVTFVGRPAAGKSWLIFRTAAKNWQINRQVVLVVSMEMNVVAVSQRLTAMYAGTNLTQLKKKGYSTPTYDKFKEGLRRISAEDTDFYVVDGNLATDVEEVYLLAAQLNVDSVYIDGAYLLRNPNSRLNRFDRVTDNAERIKRYSTELEIPTFNSYQFNRDAVAKKGKVNQKGDSAGLENIGLSDSIGQLSSVVISLMQEETVETIESRVLTLLKGRDGETGQFNINWDFINMNFDEKNLDGIKRLSYV